MMLPHPSDIQRLARERNIPHETAAELHKLAKQRLDRTLCLVTSGPIAMIEAAERAALVREETLWALYQDESSSIPWPLFALNDKLGAMMPGEIVIVGARTGVGKTTFLLNMIDRLLTRTDFSLRVLPFETPPAKLIRLLAAVRLRFNPVAVMRNQWSALPETAFSDIEGESRNLTQSPMSLALQWAPQGSMTPAQVYAEMGAAADCGCDLVVLDHLHRIALDGRNGEAEMRSLMRGLKDRAEKLELVVMIGAQLNRGERDPLRRYLPPVDTDLRGGGAIEEEADVVLGLYMPLIKNVTNGQMAGVRKGLAKVRPLVRANITGVRVIKHRIDSGPVGDDVFLTYDYGRLGEPEPEPIEYPLRPAYGGHA